MQESRRGASNCGMRLGGTSGFEFIFLTIRTDCGLVGRSFGFAGRGMAAAGHVAATTLKPFFLGKDPLARERHWQDFRKYDRCVGPVRHAP